MTRYRILGEHMLWCFPDDTDKVGILVAYIFNEDDALNLAGMLNAALGMSEVILAGNEKEPSWNQS